MQHTETSMLPVLQEVGDRLRDWRERRRLTQPEVCQRIAQLVEAGHLDARCLISQASLSQYEAGHQEVPITKLYVLATVYACHPRMFFPRTPKTPDRAMLLQA